MQFAGAVLQDAHPLLHLPQPNHVQALPAEQAILLFDLLILRPILFKSESLSKVVPPLQCIAHPDPSIEGPVTRRVH